MSAPLTPEALARLRALVDADDTRPLPPKRDVLNALVSLHVAAFVQGEQGDERGASSARLTAASLLAMRSGAEEWRASARALLATVDARDEEIARLRELAEDDPQWDGTDAAHPAWWRGCDHGSEHMLRAVEAALTESPGGTTSPRLQAIRDTIHGLRAEVERLRAAGGEP